MSTSKTYRTLQNKILSFNLTIVLGLTLLVILIGADLIRLANLPAQEEAIELKTKLTANQLAKTSFEGIVSGDRFKLQDLISTYKNDADLAFVAIWNKEGDILARVGNEIALSTMQQFSPGTPKRTDDNLIAIWTPIEIEGAPLGTIGIAYNLDRILSARLRVVLLLVFLVIAAGASAYGSYVFARKLTSPLLTMTDAFRKMATGNLRLQKIEIVSNDETGAMALAFNEMLDTMRNMVEHVRSSALQVSTAAEQILRGNQMQKQGSTEQSSAVEETRRTMEALLSSAGQISSVSDEVRLNAEQTRENNQVVTDRINQLAQHTRQIADVLETIKTIANKSELLALNAGLEGVRAGESGRGFSMVAAEMQRLAESVVESVASIKQLTSDIQQTTSASVNAIQEGGQLTASTTNSARRISLVTKQQQQNTEQVLSAINDISEVALKTVKGCDEAIRSTEELITLAQALKKRVETFQL